MKLSMKYISVRYLNFDLIFFVIAHWVCRILAALMLLVSIYALFGVLGTLIDNDFSVPRYGAEEGAREGKNKLLGAQLANLLALGSILKEPPVVEGDFVSLTKKYGDDVVDAVKKHKFGEASGKEEHSKRVLELLQIVPENLRKTYVAGWDVYLKDGLIALDARKESTADSPVMLTMQYDRYFHRAIGNARVNKLERIGARIGYGLLLLGSLLHLVLVVIVPILLAIERNGRLTRAEAAANSESPASPASPASSEAFAAPAATASCPKCGVPIEPDATFCGECGARLS